MPTVQKTEVSQLNVLASSAEITAGILEDSTRVCAHARSGKYVTIQISDQGLWGVTSQKFG